MSDSTDEIVRLEAQCESYRDQIGKLYRVCHEKTVLTLEVEKLRKAVNDMKALWLNQEHARIERAKMSATEISAFLSKIDA